MLFSVLALAAAAFAPVLVASKNITVVVGKKADGTPGNVFVPNTVAAAAGDIINFQFEGGNHTVTQSSFKEPCGQQFNTVTKQRGVDSGFFFFDNTTNDVGVWSIQINQVTSPIWMFCNRKPHCNNGMVFAINPPATGNTYEKFVETAKTAQAPGPGQTIDFTPPAANGTTPSGSASAPGATGSTLSLSPSGTATGSASTTGAPSTTSAGATSPVAPPANAASGALTPSGTVAPANGLGNGAAKVAGNTAGLLTIVALVVGLAL